ncbi:MAG: anion transporter [Planctomycetes bacterium]|nr:anion transporter [Planctomycetota bacterium]
MIVGGIPGLRLDRAGTALVGAIVLLGAGSLDTGAAWQAIDAPTILLLFGLMLVSAQFSASGFYAKITRLIAARDQSPSRLLLELMLVTGLLSALLTNDVVCLAVAPILVEVCARRRLDPVPFLLGLAAASNVGSAATVIGNPQNMLIGQALKLSFADYLRDGAVPAVLGLVVTWWLLARAWQGRLERPGELVTPIEPPFDRGQTTKGLLILGALIVGFCSNALPREVLAMAGGAAVLCSRRQTTRSLLHHVDWHLLVLFAGLFVVNHALAAAGHAARGFAWLRDSGVDIGEAPALFGVSVVGSNLISNVPLTMLLLPAATHPQSGAILCLATTLAGNLLLVGSIANLIVVEQATRLGVRPPSRGWAREHLRTGIPITLVTLAIAAGWLWLRR